MKTYVITTGAIFGLITLAHLWRLVAETQLARDPWYLALTVAAGGLGLWALRLLRPSKG